MPNRKRAQNLASLNRQCQQMFSHCPQGRKQMNYCWCWSLKAIATTASNVATEPGSNSGSCRLACSAVIQSGAALPPNSYPSFLAYNGSAGRGESNSTATPSLNACPRTPSRRRTIAVHLCWWCQNMCQQACLWSWALTDAPDSRLELAMSQ